MPSDIISFVQCVLERNRINVRLCHIEESSDFFPFDHGLREQLLGSDYDHKAFIDGVHQLPRKTLIHVTDAFGCYYSLLRLPQDPDVFFFAGPTVQGDDWKPYYQKICSQNQFSEKFCGELRKYYDLLPNLSIIGGYHTLISELGKTLFGSDLTVMNAVLDTASSFDDLSRTFLKELQQVSGFGIQSVRDRIELENQLIEAVYHGNEALAMEIVQRFGGITVPFRGTPTPTALQYRLVGLNALLRKEAEHASVPLIYANQASNRIMDQIEHLSTPKDCTVILSGMIHTYCKLVKKQSLRQYPPLIQDIIFYANSHLHADLSLNFLSGHFNINKSYLCTLFKKELGITLTEYITGLRIQYAIELLGDTSLTNQEIASLTGFNEVNYFIRKFKRLTGTTPSMYRRSQIQKRKELCKNNLYI
ncbi:AraC family transcriptional regulator [Petralouisia muris]|jgi:AraC-like DNA-binding protein|uniref:AraC family transcriptional regulator n=1 Tax=Petralouisia muris TaxID=3032872 RepID=A0AC61S0V2_9FIRM|nr:AraC family transcriptional regulator [Petralouisia muris]TGY97526.1 AraC family transcriptional regulator [Petralouisia muris]